MTMVDESVIDESQIGGLAEAAGVEGVRMILDAFWTSTAELSAELVTALKSGDADTAAKIGHALKGSSANVGAALMAERSREIEAAAKDNSLDAVNVALSKFADDIAQTKAAIETLLVRYG